MVLSCTLVQEVETDTSQRFETMATGNASNQRIIPLEEGWNDEIKAKVRKREERLGRKRICRQRLFRFGTESFGGTENDKDSLFFLNLSHVYVLP